MVGGRLAVFFLVVLRWGESCLEGDGESVQSRFPPVDPPDVSCAGRVTTTRDPIHTLSRCLVVGAMATGVDGAVIPCVQRLDGIRGATDLADLTVPIQERDELVPGRPPQCDSRRVLPAPPVSELVEPVYGSLDGRSLIDGADRRGDLVPVQASHIPERVTQQMDHTRADCRVWPHCRDRLRQACQTVTHHDEHIGTTTVLHLGEHTEPVLDSLTSTVTSPNTHDVAFPGHGHADGDIERLARHLAVANLDPDSVDEHHQLHPVQRPVHPLRHLIDDPVCDLRHRVLAHESARHLAQMGRNLTGRHTACRQRHRDLVDTVQPALPFLHDHRLKHPIPSRSRGTSTSTGPICVVTIVTGFP